MTPVVKTSRLHYSINIALPSICLRYSCRQ